MRYLEVENSLVMNNIITCYFNGVGFVAAVSLVDIYLPVECTVVWTGQIFPGTRTGGSDAFAETFLTGELCKIHIGMFYGHSSKQQRKFADQQKRGLGSRKKCFLSHMTPSKLYQKVSKNHK